MVESKFIRNVYNDSVYPVILTFDVLVYSTTEHLYIDKIIAIVLDTNNEPFQVCGNFRMIGDEDLTEEDVISLPKQFKSKGYYKTSRIVKRSTKSAIKFIKSKCMLLNQSRLIPDKLLGDKWITVRKKRQIEMSMKTSPEKLIKYYNLR